MSIIIVMNKNIKYIIVIVTIFLSACSNVSPVSEVKSSKFGSSGKALEELILKHPNYKKETLVWDQKSPKEGLIVECSYEVNEGDGFIVAMSFEVTQKTVMMTRAQIFSKNKAVGIIRHLEPEDYIDALEKKTSIVDAAIMPLYINRSKFK